MRHLEKGSCAALGAVLAFFTPVAAQAQSASADQAVRPPSDESPATAEIVVTAQKRSERLQDVPISVAVVSAKSLDAFGMNEVTDLGNVVPGLSLITAASSRSFGFFIRGIGTTSFSSESIEGSTAFVLDGVVLGQSGASLTDLPDVERIEVLRGPQGKLFGKNSSAGVVNVVTKAPSKVLTGKVSGSWAWPDDDRRIGGYLSGPLADGVAFSLSARLNKRDGYIRNLFDDRRLNGRDEWGARGKLEITSIPRLSLMLIGDYYKREADGS